MATFASILNANLDPEVNKDDTSSQLIIDDNGNKLQLPENPLFTFDYTKLKQEDMAYQKID